MDWWMWALLAIGGALLALRLWLGPGDAHSSDAAFDHCDAVFEDEPQLWTAEALARYGTETSVADLAAQGRAEELRGLGYEGDIPGEATD